jgi:DNA processing protein
MNDTLTQAARTHLRWALIDGIGPITFGRLLLHFGSAEAALGVSAAQLQHVKGIGRESADRIARQRDSADVQTEIDAAVRHGVRIICQSDEGYPEGLKRIPDPPIVLYVKGDLRPVDSVAIAVVGSRRCSIYGSEQARRFGELLSGGGFTVVSGLARGIDAFAHHGALDAGGRSIAVMGQGLREVYPPENRALAERMLASGAWISELPMQVVVRAENFPSRNRIIAGMSLGTLVVEAAARSGALITARLASEYNREVFAVPGRVQDPTAIGVNALIRDGAAKLVTCLEDILCELGELGSMLLKQREQAAGTGAASAAGPDDRPSPGPLSAAESLIYGLIGYDAILQDAIVRASELPAGEVLAAFTTLQLKGLIKLLPGPLVVRTGTA